MKRFISIMALVVLTVSMIAMTSCGKSEFGGESVDDKHMTINAVKADTGDFFVTGTLEVEEGEQVAIDTKLESGEITVEFISAEGMDLQYGARPLRRAIQRMVEDALSEEILSGRVRIGDTVVATERNGEICFETEKDGQLQLMPAGQTDTE